MKKLVVLFILMSFLVSCEKNSLTDVQSNANDNFLKSGNTLTICHLSGNEWHIININPNAWPAHEAHGDAADMDNDGYFDRECGCNDLIDCDDQDPLINPGMEEICDNNIDDNCNGEVDEGCGLATGEPALIVVDAGDYSMEVQPIDNNSSVRWASAIDECEDLVAYGHDDWYLPSQEELNIMYQQMGPSGNGYGGSGAINSGIYWSSTDNGLFDAWAQDFETGDQVSFGQFNGFAASRCVRKQ